LTGAGRGCAEVLKGNSDIVMPQISFVTKASGLKRQNKRDTIKQRAYVRIRKKYELKARRNEMN